MAEEQEQTSQPEMSDRRRAFIEKSLLKSATEAARESGYSEKSAYSQGSRLLRKDEIITRIEARRQELLEQFRTQTGVFIGALCEIAIGTMDDVLEHDGSFNYVAARERGRSDQHELADRILGDQPFAGRAVECEQEHRHQHEADAGKCGRAALCGRCRWNGSHGSPGGGRGNYGVLARVATGRIAAWLRFSRAGRPQTCGRSPPARRR